VRRTKKVIAAEVAADARQGVFGELTSLVGSYSHIALFTSSSNSQHWADLVAQAQAGDAAAAAGPDSQAAGIRLSGPFQDQANSIALADTAAAAAAAASADGREQQQSEGTGHLMRNGSRALCCTSGLGSFRQQVWLHSVPSDGGFLLNSTQEEQQQKSEQAKQEGVGAEEAAAVTAAAAANGLVASQPDVAAAATAAAAAAGSDASSRAAELKLLPNLGYACLCMTMVSECMLCCCCCNDHACCSQLRRIVCIRRSMLVCTESRQS
jgi:hypothetical protein